MRCMATYAIGDVHGCFASLTALLARLPFDAGRDRLWLVGDLVNRGPENVEVLVKYLREGRTGTAIELPGGRELAREGGSFQLRAKLPKNQ